MKQNNTLLILEPLRDFFMAQNGTDLAAAYRRLVPLNHAAAPAVSDWQTVEFAFNRLFVGPRILLAPPFASVYLDAEPQLMGRSTLKARHLYQMMGLASPSQNSIPDDHLSFELDAYRQLRLALSQVQSAELEALRHYFLHHHLKSWLPAFISKVRAVKDIPPALLFVVDQLEAWLKIETAEWFTSQSRQPMIPKEVPI